MTLRPQCQRKSSRDCGGHGAGGDHTAGHAVQGDPAPCTPLSAASETRQSMEARASPRQEQTAEGGLPPSWGEGRKAAERVSVLQTPTRSSCRRRWRAGPSAARLSTEAVAGRGRAGCRARAFTAVLSVTCSEPLLGGDTWHRAVPTVSDRLSEKHGGRRAPSSLRAQAGTGRRHAAGRLARLRRPLDRRRGLAYWVGVSWVESL